MFRIQPANCAREDFWGSSDATYSTIEFCQESTPKPFPVPVESIWGLAIIPKARKVLKYTNQSLC